MTGRATESTGMPTCRFYVAASSRPKRPARVIEIPQWLAPAVDLLKTSAGPLAFPPLEIEKLGRAGLPLRTTRKGVALAAKVEAISLPPPSVKSSRYQPQW